MPSVIKVIGWMLALNQIGTRAMSAKNAWPVSALIFSFVLIGLRRLFVRYMRAMPMSVLVSVPKTNIPLIMREYR